MVFYFKKHKNTYFTVRVNYFIKKNNSIKSHNETEVVTDLLLYCDVHQNKTEDWKTKNVGWDLVQSTCCWLDVKKKKRKKERKKEKKVEFKWTKWLEKSDIHHQRESVISPGDL